MNEIFVHVCMLSRKWLTPSHDVALDQTNGLNDQSVSRNDSPQFVHRTHIIRSKCAIILDI